jgi:cell division protein FtsQ
MWDNPQALRKLGNALFGASLLLLLLIALAYVLRLPVFALRAVQLEAVPQRVDNQLLAAAARESLRGNFFTVSLDRARAPFEKLPWVRSVSVRRHFPWQLDVALEEYAALARWNGKQLVSTQGEVFDARDEDALPEFTGPEGAAAEMARRYADFSAVLSPLNLKISQVVLSPRHAWQLRLDSGLVLELGREQMDERLARFAAAYPQYRAAMKASVKYVDLRYRNGFAAG